MKVSEEVGTVFSSAKVERLAKTHLCKALLQDFQEGRTWNVQTTSFFWDAELGGSCAYAPAVIAGVSGPRCFENSGPGLGNRL